ncbi:hypothetical protein ASPVEDRAFT_45060 [Aspergillus versicolor CBS 583.65]|uniref:Zn(2)-C6 fungal-type domain-containing protein n=1 Tax=Aspergillus versicolor CBS 583.65 TaxID=1036611 RepID=A0A1L9PVN7_ASPVE|nr:uncharacterized protein ASPVEDRAFT_45060 [Aspergillus versicolor CBS 583.65]OJJ05533.1 hypothetical protein ASPVEDRAFT_45060 [Aspergillus versicolor CBS 583.65]
MSGTRSRKGCATCRERRQKCDETKPTCLNCRSRGIECGGYAIRLTDFNHYEGYDGQMVCKMIRGDESGKPPRPGRRTKRRKVRTTLFGDDSDAPVQRTPRLSDCSNLESSSPKPQSQASEEIIGSPESNDPLFLLKAPRDANSARTHRGSQITSDSSPQAAADDPLLWPDVPLPVASDLLFPQHEDLLMDISCSSSLQGLLSPTLWPEDLAPTMSTRPGLSTIFNEPLGAQSSTYDSNIALSVVEPRSSPGDNTNHPFGDLVPPEVDQCVLNSTPSDPRAFDNYLFKHFVDVLAPSLHPLNPDRNPYTVVYATLAGSCQVLYNAILSASADHLVYLGQLPVWATGPYRRAMQDSFQRAIGASNMSRSTAAAMLLCIAAEVVGSGMGVWSTKLGGAHKLLASTMRGEGVPSEMKFLWLQYTWMSVIGRTLWIPGRSQMPPTDLQPPGQDLELDLQLAEEQERWFGNMPDYSMVIFLRTASNLVRKLNQVASQPNPVQATQRLLPDIADLINQVRAWRPQRCSANDPYTTCAAEIGEIWRQGLLCYIYAELCALPRSDIRIQEAVAAAVPAIRKLTWMQSVLWPVFMIGVHAVGQEDQAAIEQGLLMMNSTLKFKTPLSLVDIFRQVWCAAEGSSVDWKTIISKSGMELNILL